MGVDVKSKSSGVETPAAKVDGVWDGRVHSYRPDADWRDRVSPSLEFHEEVEADLDPVTYEVIRHRLWTINMAHGETITRISGSPVFATLDFNMCILSEDAEVVLNAPFIQYLDAGAPLAMRYIMEHFAGAPGIEEGDLYLSNDPWIGAAHQMDVLIACPVFVDGKLFAWVSSAGHQYDLGGIVPGGWPQNAPDVYSDPVVLPPFKLVEAGHMRSDLEAMYLRQSRLPDLVAFDLRAQISGANFASQQLIALCDQFSAATVKAAMRRVLDMSQRSFQEKLGRIPNGRWSEVRYFDESLPGDRTTHRMQVNLTKEGDRITVTNEGTEEQGDGPICFTFSPFSGAVIGMVSVMMLYEQLFAIGGADRQIDYDPTPGVLNCADYPAAVSGGVVNLHTHMAALQTCFNRMLVCDPELKEDVIAAGPEWPLPILTGTDDRGNFFGSALLDGYALGSGARSFRDGTDTSGPPWSPLSFQLNVEQVEQWYPVVYLYRKETVDGGGAGRWRGGTGMDYAVTPYRAKAIEVVTNCGGMGVSTHGGEGVFGGYPSPTGNFRVATATNLLEMFANRRLPGDVRDLEAGESFFLRGKSNGTPLQTGDVFASRFVGGGGYGDPIERDAARVAVDVALGYVSKQAARDVYGVELGEGFAVDEAATARRRETMLEERAGWAPVAGQPGAGDGSDVSEEAATGEGNRFVHEYVVAVDQDGRRILRCGRCKHELGGYRDNYKRHLLVDRSSVMAIPTVADPSFYLDEEIEFRRYCCPGCRVQMTTEVVRASEPILDEMRLIGG
jgi:N-methylhydantoinase B